MLTEHTFLVGFDLDALFLSIECPSLLIQGNPILGAALFDEDLDQALTMLRHGARVSFPEGGHMLHHSHPEAVSNALSEFCNERL